MTHLLSAVHLSPKEPLAPSHHPNSKASINPSILLPTMPPNLQTTVAQKMYTDRAPNYDTATGGWHVELGHDFATWVSPAPGSAILDLACGTGLVTLPMAAAVGPSGIVIGVDVTSAMLDQARQKKLPEGTAQVEWVEADITEGRALQEVYAVRRVVEERGGFDVIACCSALVLLDDPTSVVRKWVELLKIGGRLIIDVPTEDRTVQYLFVVALRGKLGMPLPFDRDWTQGVESLEKVYKEAGLVVEKSWKTKSYIGEIWHEDEESVRDEVFETQSRDLFTVFAKEGRLEDARAAWKDVWKLGVEDGKGKVYGGHPLYVSIGRKAESTL